MQEEIRLQNLNRIYQPNAGTTTIFVPGYGQGQQGNNVYGQPINPGFGQQVNLGQPVYEQPYYAQPSIGQPVYSQPIN